MDVGLGPIAAIALEKNAVQEFLTDAAVSRLVEGVERKLVRRRPRVRRRIVVQRQLNELDPLSLGLLRLGVTAGGRRGGGEGGGKGEGVVGGGRSGVAGGFRCSTAHTLYIRLFPD